MTFADRSASDPRDAAERYEHRFGASPPLSLGVEEELLLVDKSHQLVTCAETVLKAVSGSLGERASSEIFTEQIELKTSVCDGASEVLGQLREMRRTVFEAGFGLLGCGLHPSVDSGEPTLVSKPRYEVVRKDFGNLLKTPPCGLHVHVGISDPEVAVRLANAFRLYLPVLQALSANSPFPGGSRLRPRQRPHLGGAQLSALPGPPRVSRLRGLLPGRRPADRRRRGR